LLRSNQIEKLTPVLAEDVFNEIFCPNILKPLATPASEYLRQVFDDIAAYFVEVRHNPEANRRRPMWIAMLLPDVPNDSACRIAYIIGTDVKVAL